MIDSGVQGSHKELHPNYDNQNSTNTIPCNTLTTTFGNASVKAFGRQREAGMLGRERMPDGVVEDVPGHGACLRRRRRRCARSPP